MLNKDTIIKVTNRSYGGVGYAVPDLGIRREYQPGETKEVTFEELLKLSYTIAGRNMIERYLVIHSREAVDELLGEVEPEYFYTEKEVEELLLHGTVAQLEDCIDFGQEGVVDLVKKLAVDLKINDVQKRDIIQEKTGFNVNSAIQITEDTADEKVKTKAKRRSSPIVVNEDEAPKRKAGTPKYKIVTSVDK